MTLHLTQLEGGNALSSFRAQQLLTELVSIHPKITGIAARFVHLVATDAAPTPALQERLQALLTYGDPYEGPADGAALVVTPRLGTISPWASKATDIARNCGLGVFRVERITEYRIAFKTGLLSNVLGSAPELSAEQTARIAALLHDRMTESVFATRAEAEQLF
ncbi:MAG: phosphoribosylformylglycinamidine synthase, partial [Delftia sp.]|nr:phosphoribosylformylglycinamidine synthase [Delftia sp.]